MEQEIITKTEPTWLPQFSPSITTTGYHRITILATKNKIYFGVIIQRGRIVKRTSKAFKKASDAEEYAAEVFARYRRLVDGRVRMVMVG